MPKNKVTAEKYDELLDLDFSDDENPDDGAIADMMTSFVEASKHQQEMAIELTKMVHKSTENLSEEQIFSTFKRATKMVSENFPLKELWEKFN